MCESFFATLECELLARHRFRTAAEAQSTVFAFIEGWYNPRRRHSSIGYRSPLDYERQHQVTTVDPDAHQRAAALAPVKDKPFGRPQEGAVLDRRHARQPHQRAGRGRKNGSAGGRTKE
jgi:putative transposase